MAHRKSLVSRAINAMIEGRVRSAARDIAFYRRRFDMDARD